MHLEYRRFGIPNFSKEKEMGEEMSEEARLKLRYEDEKRAEAARLKKLEEEKMAKWATYAKKHLKEGDLFVSGRGEVYRLVKVLEQPDPKAYESGKYRAEYMGEDDPRSPCKIQMPLGTFEMLGAPTK
jgi:hypothetical protein